MREKKCNNEEEREESKKSENWRQAGLVFRWGPGQDNRDQFERELREMEEVEGTQE